MEQEPSSIPQKKVNRYTQMNTIGQHPTEEEETKLLALTKPYFEEKLQQKGIDGIKLIKLTADEIRKIIREVWNIDASHCDVPMQHRKFRVVERFFEKAKKYFWEHKTWGVLASRATKHDPKAIAKLVEDLKPEQKRNLSEAAKNLGIPISSLHNVKKRAKKKEGLNLFEFDDRTRRKRRKQEPTDPTSSLNG